MTSSVWWAIFLGALCGVGFLKSFGMGLALLLSLGAGAVAIWRPMICWKAALFVQVALVVFLTEKTEQALSWGLVLLFMVGAWLECRKADPSIGRFPPILGGCLLAWLLWALLGIPFSIDPALSIREVVRYGISFGFFLILLNWVRDIRRMRSMFRWLGFLALGAACLSVANHLSLNLPHAEGLSLPLAVAIPIRLSQLLAALSRRTSPFGWAIWIFLWVALALTGVRSAGLAAYIGTGIVLGWMSPKGFRLFLMGTAVTALAAGGWLNLRYSDPASVILENLSGRPLLWKAALEAIRENPLIGIGPGGWEAWFPRKFVAADFLLYDRMGNSFVLQPAQLGGEAHQLLLTKAAEMGIPSAAGLAAMFVLWLSMARQGIRRLPVGELKMLAVGCFSAACGLFFQGFFENGPLIGRARELEISLVWLIVAVPLIGMSQQRLFPGRSPVVP